MEHISLILTAIGCTATATSALVWAIAGLKEALAVHTIKEETAREALGARVIKLERRRK
jgi:hypothetical protein